MSASAGRVLLKPKGPYNALTAYTPLDYVTYTDGNTYVCHTPTTGHAPTDTNYWQILVDNSGVVHTVDIANDLTTQTAGKVLDARQGYALNTSLAQQGYLEVTIQSIAVGTYTTSSGITNIDKITSDMSCVYFESSNAAAYLDINIATGNQQITVTGTIVGTTNLKMRFIKQRTS